MHGDLQGVSVDCSRSAEFGQFAARQIVEVEGIGEQRTGLRGKRKAATHIGRGDAKVLGSRIEREGHRRAGGAALVGVVHHFGEVVVIDDRLGRGFGSDIFLAQIAGNVSQGSFTGVVLRVGKRGCG